MMFILLLHPPGLGFFLPHDSKLPYSCSAQCVCVCVFFYSTTFSDEIGEHAIKCLFDIRLHKWRLSSMPLSWHHVM